MPYQAYLTIAPRSGQTRAHVPDLPGCSLRGKNRADVLVNLPTAIAAYLAWLQHHGEPIPPGGRDVSVEIAGETTGQAALHPGDRAALLPADLLPLTDSDVARYLRLMCFSREDLLQLLSGVEESLLDWHPPPGGWTIRHVLRHISGAERWYLDRLGLHVRLPRTRTLLENLALTRSYAYDVLSKLTPEQRTIVVTKDGESWTARKVFRRFLEHEREHTGQIQDILRSYRG